ncbi:hypothetical protein ES708_13248 [subsurface metagenome]
MARMNPVKLKTLEQTRNFYLWQLKREESLTESEKSKFLLALKKIDKVIEEKEEPDKRVKSKTIFKGSY